MQIATQENAVVSERSANGKFANDGSLASVEAMLTKQAALFYTRVLSLGLPMEFADVKQELMMAYVKARAKWNPEKARFNTYCFTVARNEFNRRIERMAMDRQHLGMGSIDDYHAASEETSDVGDGFDRYMSQEADEVGPEARIERRQALADRLASLSPPTRRLVAMLVQNETNQNQPTMTLREMAVHMGLVGPALVEVQREIVTVFGVTVPFGTRKKVTPA